MKYDAMKKTLKLIQKLFQVPGQEQSLNTLYISFLLSLFYTAEYLEISVY